MSNWKSALKADPIPWLLEPDNPSVRYWALRDLLDRPEDAAEMQAARAAVAQSDVVQQLLAAQQPDGYWGDDPRQPYGAARTPFTRALEQDCSTAVCQLLSASYPTYERDCSKSGERYVRKLGIDFCINLWYNNRIIGV
jgi:hypothetical protein